MADRAYAFIDGAAFEATVSKLLAAFDCSEEDINWDRLTRNAARIYYFDALPTQKNGEKNEDFIAKLEAKSERFRRLRRVPNFHIREGVARAGVNSGRPGAQRQKGVDIALATEVMIHAFRENMDIARLFVSDLDFFPLLDALTSTRVRTELFFDLTKTAAELIDAADVAFELNHLELYWSLPPHAQSRVGFKSPSQFETLSVKRTGTNDFGEVNLLFDKVSGDFTIRGKINPHDGFENASATEMLLIEHFESVAKSRVNWTR